MATSTTVALKKKKVSTQKRAKVTVSVEPASAQPVGDVVHFGSKTLTVALTTSDAGKIQVALPKLKRGKYKVYATYSGSSSLLESTSGTVTLRVK